MITNTYIYLYYFSLLLYIILNLWATKIDYVDFIHVDQEDIKKKKIDCHTKQKNQQETID